MSLLIFLINLTFSQSLNIGLLYNLYGLARQTESEAVEYNNTTYTLQDLANNYYELLPENYENLTIKERLMFSYWVSMDTSTPAGLYNDKDLSIDALEELVRIYNNGVIKRETELFSYLVVGLMFNENQEYLSMLLGRDDKITEYADDVTSVLDKYKNAEYPLDLRLTIVYAILNSNSPLKKQNAALEFINSLSYEDLQNRFLFGILGTILSDEFFYSRVDDNVISAVFENDKLSTFTMIDRIIMDQSLSIKLRKNAIELMEQYLLNSMTNTARTLVMIASIDNKELLNELSFKERYYKNFTFNENEIKTLENIASTLNLYGERYALNFLKFMALAKVAARPFSFNKETYTKFFDNITILIASTKDSKLRNEITKIFTFVLQELQTEVPAP